MADSGASHCFICTEKIVIYSTGPCNHPICHLCSLRLRALYKTNECSSCRAPQLKVLFSSTSKAFSEDALASCPKQDAKLGIFFETADIASKVLRILRFNCPSCRAVCSNGWTELKAHVTKIHNKVICDICSKHKKVFTHELSLYTESGLVEHLNRGDKNDPSFKGHPYCGFCATHYYSKDELFEHCRQAHETCFICKRRGVLDVYYQNYARLEEHFRSDHYFCTEKACLDKKFVVFETDIDLRAHDVEEHPGKVKRGKSTPIELNFQYGPGSSHSAGGSRESGNRGGNGDGRRNGGGRSQQQQSSHQLHQTRVSEPRAASPFMQRTSSSSSLHDASLGLEEGPSQGEAAARFVPASEPSVRDRVARKAPPGFGAGLTKEPSKESVRASSSQPQTPPSGAAQKPIAPPAVSGDPEVISRLQLLLSSSDSKFAEFKSLATSFKASILSADEFFQGLLSLCMDGKSNSLKMSIEKEVGQLWVRLADTLPVEETVRSNNKGKGKGVPLNGADGGKKQEMLKTWNNYRARVSDSCLVSKEEF